MESLLPILIIVAVLGVIAYLLWRSRPTAESIRRQRAAAAGVTEEFFTAFEQRALTIDRCILQAARQRLVSEAERHGLPTAEALDGAATAAEPPLARAARMRAAARELAEGIASFRRLRERAFSSPEYARAEEQWAYLSVAYADRYPLLADSIERLDERGLERLGSASPLEAARQLRSELDTRLATYREIEASLEADPSTIWSVLCLVVLTMSLTDFTEAEQTALASRANPRAADSWITLMNVQLKAALRIAHGVPPCDRISHQGVLALPLPDRDLGAALVQFCANEASAQGELDQARVLTMGDSAMLWLAHDVIRIRPYPDAAVAAYAKLAPLVRRALHSAPAGADAALQALDDAAKQEVDEPTSERIRSTVVELRAGKSAEQIRGGTAGHEAHAE